MSEEDIKMTHALGDREKFALEIVPQEHGVVLSWQAGEYLRVGIMPGRRGEEIAPCVWIMLLLALKFSTDEEFIRELTREALERVDEINAAFLKNYSEEGDEAWATFDLSEWKGEMQ